MKLPLTLFLDTNVMLDGFLPRREFNRDAGLILLMAQFDDAKLHCSTSMLTDLFYIVKKSAKRASRVIQEEMEDLLFGSLSRNIYLHTVDTVDVREALRRRWPDFEDCLVNVCAERVGADYIVTRDAHGFDKSSVPAIPPRALLEKLKRENDLTYDEIEW